MPLQFHPSRNRSLNFPTSRLSSLNKLVRVIFLVRFTVKLYRVSSFFTINCHANCKPQIFAGGELLHKASYLLLQPVLINCLQRDKSLQDTQMTRIFVYYSIKHEKSLFEIDTVNCEGSGNELSVSRQVCSLNQRNDRHRRPAYRQRDMRR